jgi:hypothetical protein
MARQIYDCTLVNAPKTIAGIEWKIFVGVAFFFGYGALMFRVPYLLISPVVIFLFLRGPGAKDPMFLRIHLRHRAQRNVYSPHYLCAPNHRNPRPLNFSRSNWF